MNKLNFNLKLFKVLIILNFSYSSINAQTFNVGDTLNPTITYVDIHDTILPFVVKGSFNFDIDVDFDNIKDIRFHRDHMSSPSFSSETFSVLSLDSVQFVVRPGSSDSDTLSYGTVIENSLNWNNNYNGACFYYYFSGMIPPPWGPPSSSHGICINPNTYIGFRKINQSDTLYGWFYLDLLSPYKVRSYAINKIIPNSVPDKIIQSDNINIFPNPTSDFIQIETNLNETRNFQLTIMNSNGQVIMRTELDLIRKHSMDIRDYENGLYFIILSNTKERYVSKFVVNNNRH
jgi:hypothetical protein